MKEALPQIGACPISALASLANLEVHLGRFVI
jgi:hypothetical protein